MQVNENDQWNGNVYGYEKWNDYGYEQKNFYGYEQGNGNGYDYDASGYEFYQVMLSEVGMWFVLFISVFVVGYLFWNYMTNVKLKPALFCTLNFKNLKFGLWIMIIATFILESNGSEIRTDLRMKLTEPTNDLPEKLNDLSLFVLNTIHALPYVVSVVNPPGMLFYYGEGKGEGENASLYASKLLYGLMSIIPIMCILNLAISIKYWTKIRLYSSENPYSNTYLSYRNIQSFIYKKMVEYFWFFWILDGYTLIFLIVGLFQNVSSFKSNFVMFWARYCVPSMFGLLWLTQIKKSGIQWLSWPLQVVKALIRTFSVVILSWYWTTILVNNGFPDHDELWVPPEQLKPFTLYLGISSAFNVVDYLLSKYYPNKEEYLISVESSNRYDDENKKQVVYVLQTISHEMIWQTLASAISPFWASSYANLNAIYYYFTKVFLKAKFDMKLVAKWFFVNVIIFCLFNLFMHYFIMAFTSINMLIVLLAFAYFIRYS